MWCGVWCVLGFLFGLCSTGAFTPLFSSYLETIFICGPGRLCSRTASLMEGASLATGVKRERAPAHAGGGGGGSLDAGGGSWDFSASRKRLRVALDEVQDAVGTGHCGHGPALRAASCWPLFERPRAVDRLYEARCVDADRHVELKYAEWHSLFMARRYAAYAEKVREVIAGRGGAPALEAAKWWRYRSAGDVRDFDRWL